MKHTSDERGTAAILMSVLLSSGLLLALGALAVDLGQMYETRREAQLAADLAATAGGGLLQIDRTEACRQAIYYLEKDNPYNIDLQAIPNASTCTASGTAPNQVDGNRDGTLDSRIVTVTDTSLRVVVPGQKVSFGFASAFGINEASVNAGATVALRSFGGGIGPFAIPAGCLTATPSQWYFTIKDGPNGNDKGTPQCTDPATGSFGWLKLMRGTNYNAADLSENIRYGADHRVGWVPGVDPLYLGDATDVAPDCNGTIDLTSTSDITYDPRPESAGPYTEPTLSNCAGIQKGNISAATEPLIGKKGGTDPCSGRLNDLTGPAGVKIRKFDDCDLNGYRLQDFLAPGKTMSDVRNGIPGSLTSDVIDNPNFMVVPIVFSTGRPKEQETPIVGFRGFFLDCPEPAGSCTHPFGASASAPISEVNGFVFQLRTIAPRANSGDVEDYYMGTGLAIPVLTSDPLN